MGNVCEMCYHNYVCEQYNQDRDFPREKCAYFNSHFVDADSVKKVVRCSRCEAAKPTKTTNTVFCIAWDRVVSKESFCPYGVEKRKDVEQDGKHTKKCISKP